MDNDETILREILNKEAARRGVRHAFAQEVIHRLPKRKRPFASRRTLLVTSFAFLGCLAASVTAWSDIKALASGFFHLMKETDAVKQSLAGFILASPLAFVAALVVAVYCIARREKLI